MTRNLTIRPSDMKKVGGYTKIRRPEKSLHAVHRRGNRPRSTSVHLPKYQALSLSASFTRILIRPRKDGNQDRVTKTKQLMHGMGYRILFERMMVIMYRGLTVAAVGWGVGQGFLHDV